MKLRSLSLETTALVLVAGSLVALSASAQSVYDEERLDTRSDSYQRDVDARHDVSMEREVRSLPPRNIKLDVASVDERYDRAFRQQTLGRKMGAADWAELRRQRSEIDSLKSQINAGHSVSPSAVDRALGYDDQRRVGY